MNNFFLIFIIGIIAVIIILSTPYIIPNYNQFKTLINSSEAELNQVRVAMKKRLDKIQQLMDLASSYANFEKRTYEKIIQLRNSIPSANPKELHQVDTLSNFVFGRLIAVAENYPQLKTDEIIRLLMLNITDIENEISERRYDYNDIVKEYNTLIDIIPSNFVAFLFRFKKIEYLAFEEKVIIPPELKF